MGSTLVTKHNAGFFSCCHMKLFDIINYFNLNKKLPDIVDSSAQFKWYKINKEIDITYEYFENNKTTSITYNEFINTYCQYTIYSKINYTEIKPFINKYFSPSPLIKNIIKDIKDKYNIDYDNICVLFYRGHDKNRETLLCTYDEYIDKANIILKKHPEVKFLIQSDESEFIIKMREHFPNNSFHFKEEIRHMPKCNDSVDLWVYIPSPNLINVSLIRRAKLNYIFSKYYLAITIIMSKCKYIICGSGNCSIWIMFYRENGDNIFQNINGEWVDSII
jgi:hypothetical protein